MQQRNDHLLVHQSNLKTIFSGDITLVVSHCSQTLQEKQTFTLTLKALPPQFSWDIHMQQNMKAMKM